MQADATNFDPKGDAAELIRRNRELLEQVRQLQEALEGRINERTADLARINETLHREIEERKRAEKAVKRSEDFLRLVIDTIPGLVWSALPDGNIEYLNKRWIDFTGLTLEEASGWGWQAAVHPGDLPGLLEYWKGVLASGEPGETEARLRRHDGEYRWLLFRAVPLYDEQGILLKWYGTNTDIEALRASEHLARGQFEALSKTLDALANESLPDRLIEYVMLTVTRQLGAHSSSIWERSEETGLLSLAVTLEGGALVARPERGAVAPSYRVDEVWPWPEVFRTGRPSVLEDIRTGPSFPWKDQLLAQGIVTILVIPMSVGGHVQGVIGIRFTEKRTFRSEEMDLAQALAHQAMLAMRLSRLSRQGREAAVVEERNRMAREIHDTLAQGFTGVIVQLEAAEDAASKGLAGEAQVHVSRAGELARYGLSEARRSVQALRPQLLEGNNLCVAIVDLFKRMTGGTSLHFDFALEGEPKSIPPEWEENLLRIAQEVLTNALRHAYATRIAARLIFEPAALRLKLQDNGRGFDPQSRHDGFGLVGMRERVEQMGGRMQIHSGRGEGTTVSLDLPLTGISQPSTR